MSDSVPWSDVFCGRAEELARLETAWHAVSSGEGPQAVALIAESGLGKTRIAQEFYRRLATGLSNDAGDGYWPDCMSRQHDNLAINPSVAECRAEAKMRFLWWGVRCPDPVGRNASRGGVAADADILKSHLVPFAEARLRADRRRDIAGGIALDLATEVANVFTFGLVGLAKSAYGHASDLIRSERRDTAHTAEARLETTQTTLLDAIVRDFETLFSERADHGARLPAVILVDDAQWMHHDPLTLRTLMALLTAATRGGWPLLLVVTYWENEWRQHNRDAQDTFAPKLTEKMGRCLDTIFLKPEQNLSALVAAGLPGLSPSQQKLILEKADGNPRLMDEILRHFRSKPRYFERRDVTDALSTRGEVLLNDSEFDLHDLIFERLSTANEDMRLDLGLASVQGVRFAERLVTAVRHTLYPQDTGVSDGLDQAIDPYAMVNRHSPDIAEFAQRVYWEVAREQLEDFLSSEDVEMALADALRQTAGPDANFASFTPEERAVACRLVVLLIDGADCDADMWLRLASLWEICTSHRQDGNSEGFREDAQLLAETIDAVQRTRPLLNYEDLLSFSETAEALRLLPLAERFNWQARAALESPDAPGDDLAAFHELYAEARAISLPLKQGNQLDIPVATAFIEDRFPRTLAEFTDLEWKVWTNFCARLDPVALALLPQIVLDRMEEMLPSVPPAVISVHTFNFTRMASHLLEARLVRQDGPAPSDVAERFRAILSRVETRLRAGDADDDGACRGEVPDELANLAAQVADATKGVWRDWSSADDPRTMSIAQLRALHEAMAAVGRVCYDAVTTYFVVDKNCRVYLYSVEAASDEPDKIILLTDINVIFIRRGGMWWRFPVSPADWLCYLDGVDQITFIQENMDGEPVRGWEKNVVRMTTTQFATAYAAGQR